MLTTMIKSITERIDSIFLHERAELENAIRWGAVFVIVQYLSLHILDMQQIMHSNMPLFMAVMIASLVAPFWNLESPSNLWGWIGLIRDIHTVGLLAALGAALAVPIINESPVNAAIAVCILTLCTNAMKDFLDDPLPPYCNTQMSE